MKLIKTANAVVQKQPFQHALQ